MTSAAGIDDFTHQLAVKLSRVLNIVNPNDLLARTVINLARTHPPEGFAKGVPSHPILSCGFLYLMCRVITAARAFGKFQDSFLAELHSEILSHEKREATGAPSTVAGIIVHDSDVLEPEPVRQGGLVRPDKVRDTWTVLCISCSSFLQRHAFRQPVRPIEPPTPRASLLGLDRLAQEKRDAAGSMGSRKKPRLDNDDEPVFKGFTFIAGSLRPCLSY
jgi:pre-mRNA-splicing factor ATP-dependent RNA helicase DHX38/PRP16